jgi:hypothetical protein
LTVLQEQIQSFQSSLRNYSSQLANRNLLVDIPWTMVDGDLNLQRLIFNRNNSLYIITEGVIQESTWEYLPSMNSLVISIEGIRIVMNEVFIDEKVLILKKDGNSKDFLAFANETKLQDLNLVNHLKSIQPKEILPPIEEPGPNWMHVILLGLFLLILVMFFFN